MNSNPNRPNNFLRAHRSGFPVPGSTERSFTFTLPFSILLPPGGLYRDPSLLLRHVTLRLLEYWVGVATALHFILLAFAAEFSSAWHTTLPHLTSSYIRFSSCFMLATLLASLGGVSAPFPREERASEPFVITSRLSSGYMSNCLTWCPLYFQMKYNLVWIFLSYLSSFDDIVRAIKKKKICAYTQTLPMNFSSY